MTVERLRITVPGQGLHEFTHQVEEVVTKSGVSEGVCTVFVQHTSASLTVQENADPSARRDLEQWLNRLVREGDPLFTHTLEGADDMPSHIKSALTATSLSIPVLGGPSRPRDLAGDLPLGAPPRVRAAQRRRPRWSLNFALSSASRLRREFQCHDAIRSG